MKSLYVTLGVLALLVTFSLWCGEKVCALTDSCAALVDEASRQGSEENWAGANQSLARARALWEGDSAFLHTALEHGELDEVALLFSGAEAACRRHDGTEFHILTAQLLRQLRLIADSQRVSIPNIL